MKITYDCNNLEKAQKRLLDKFPNCKSAAGRHICGGGVGSSSGWGLH